MADPTTYDVEQDQRISTLEGLVTTIYTPPSGNEISFPVVGQAMDDSMWQQVTLGVGSGNLDQGGSPYNLTSFDNATNTAKLTVATNTKIAQAILKGFYHRMQADITISLPPVSAATSYYIMLEYDPLRHGQPGGPVRVQTKTALDSTSGKLQLVQWQVDRKPNQLLTEATVLDCRTKVIPTIQVDSLAALPKPNTQLWGTLALVGRGTTPALQFRAGGSSDANGGPAQWVPTLTTEWRNLNLGSGYTTAFQTPQYRLTADGAVEFRGSAKRTSEANLTTGAFTYFANVPGAVDWDGMTSTQTGGTGSKSITIKTTSGGTGNKELSYYTEDTMVWLSLDGFKAWVKAVV